ncbi:MAG: hypothetical protein QXU13_04605 [Desulfurococcaceae archaeon]
MVIEQVKILFNNTWYLEPGGFRKGFIFVDGLFVKSTGAEPEPEYEFSELSYDLGGYGVVVHGYSMIIDTLEYFLKGFRDYSIFTKQELKKIMEASLLRSYVSGVTLPIVETPFVDLVMDIAREYSFRIGVIVRHDDRYDFMDKNILFIVKKNNNLYSNDKVITQANSVCKPEDVSPDCNIIDARGYGALFTGIEIVFKRLRNPLLAYRLLTNPYRLLSVDDGFVQSGASADLLVYDLKDPLKSLPLSDPEQCYEVLSRTSTPDIVVVNGNVVYERGENLVFTLSKLHEIVGKAIKSK